MTLESEWNRCKPSYEGKPDWMWEDEGRIWCIQGYLSSCGEMTEADWEFARKVGIEEDVIYEIKRMDDV